jgi:hypothetical protein
LKQPTIGRLVWLVSFHVTDPGSSKGFNRKGPVAMLLVSRSEFFIYFGIVGNLKSIFCEKRISGAAHSPKRNYKSISGITLS